jgi:hypothetical protein
MPTFAQHCEKCQHWFGTDEPRDVGTFWESICAINCPKCGHENRFTVAGGPKDIDAFILMLAGGETSSRKYKTSIDDRVRQNRVREYWVQKYIAENFAHLGFEALNGPFAYGPDFKVKRNGVWLWAEAEVKCKNYVRHKHHENPKWQNCSILIVLDESDPAPEIQPHLPSETIHLDKSHFLGWYEPAAKQYAEAREREEPAKLQSAILNQTLAMLATEIRKRLQIPYDEDFSDAMQWTDDLALEFICQRMKGKDGDFKLASVTAAELDEFCSPYRNPFAY